ncbi:MAG: hypothetical protein ACI4S0_01715 [Dorea sp.]
MRKIVKRIIVSAMAIIISIGTFVVNSADVSAASNPTVTYTAHCQNIGWTSWVSNGQTAGTTGQNRQMEAIQIKLSGVIGNIIYRAHCQDIGWTSWVSNGQTAGTTGQNRQMEAIQIKLTGEVANQYSVQYRAHCQDIGWTSWVSDGQTAGTTGQNRQMEAIQIKLVAKSSYSRKVNEFINDSRWKNGVEWSASKRPCISTYSSTGCCAYAADFVKYVFNKNSPRGGSIFYNPSEIKAGDVIYVSGSSHWFVVLERNGNQLKTAEGNWGSKVVIGYSYSVSGNTLMRNGSKFRTFQYGYHFQ